MTALGMILSKGGISDSQYQEISRLLALIEPDLIVHLGNMGAERLDYLAYRLGIKRRAYCSNNPHWPGHGLFVRDGNLKRIKRVDADRHCYLIGDSDLLIACPLTNEPESGNRGLWGLIDLARDKGKAIRVISRRGLCEDFNGFNLRHLTSRD